MTFDPKCWLYESELVEGEDLGGRLLDPIEAYDTTFRRVGFGESTLRRWVLEGCTFEDCDLSLATFDGATFSGVRFVGCKLVGVDWRRLGGVALDATFEGCILRLGQLAELRLRDVSFRDCDLRECDLTDADLQGVDLSGSDLTGALVDGANLQQADLTRTIGLELDPRTARLRGAKVSTELALDLAERLGVVVVA